MLTDPVIVMGDQADDSASEEISDTDEFIFAPQSMSESVVLPDFTSLDPETQERLQALLHAAGITKIGNDGRAVADPDLLKRLTSSVSTALDEAAAAITRMKSDGKSTEDGSGTAVISADLCGGGASASGEEGESLLSLACSAGYYELAQVLLAMRTNVEDRGSKGDCTPLMEAASAGHADIVKLLIAHGADVNAQSATGNTPLMYACAGGHEEVVRVLLDASVDVELHNENGHSPLMEAASAGHVEIARLLVDHGAQVNAQSSEFKVGLESPLTLACYKGHLHMVKYLLQVGNVSSPGRQEELHTALMEASMDGHVEVARLLLDAGARVNLPTDSFESPLTLAACGGHLELAKLLLERGANLEEPNDEGYTPLMEAAREGHEDVCRLLLEWNADVNAQTEETGETALTLACCGGFQEVASLLLDHGSDIEAGANTPLMEAAQEGHADLVRFLIKRGADVNAATGSGDTPLTYAAENGHTEVCVALLDAGADLEHGADGGRTALMKAARAGHDCTVTLLISRGTEVNRATTTTDHTALSLACTGGHLTTVELLLRNGADLQSKLKDGTTCVMEAAKGGHTNVVQLLLDWPTLHPTPPALAALTFPPSCAEAATVTVLPEGQAVLDAVPVGSDGGGQAVTNLTPEFNLQLAMAAVSNQNYPSLATPSLFNYEANVGSNNSVITGPILPTIPARAEADSYLGDNEDEKDPLTMEKAALLQQVSEKLSLKDYQKLQEILKVQFQETAAQLASRVPQNNTSPVVQSSPKKTLTGPNSGQGGVAAKSKKAELEQAMKELEQLKKTQHLYEQIQKALEAKAAAAAAAAAAASSNEKTKATRAKSVPGKGGKEEKKEKNILLAPSPPPPPPSTTPPPPSLLPNMVTGSGSVQFQLPPLDQAQMQYLQQQFSLALQQQQQARFNFQPGSAAAAVDPSTAQIVFPELPTTASVGTGGGGLPGNLDGKSEDDTQDQHLSNKLFVPIQLSSESASASASSAGTNTQTQLEQSLRQQPAPPQSAPFNLPASNVGFNFTPQHLLPPPPPLGSTATATTDPTASSLQAPRAVLDFDQKTLLSFPTAAYATPVVTQSSNTKSTQTGVGTGTATTTTTVYQPQAGAFQPPNNYQLAGTGGGQDATATLYHHHHHHHLPSCQQQSRPVDLNTQTESNHDTALTLACAGGHEELVSLLLQRGADIEHRDKKGFTPLILAATAGHAGVVEILVEHGANVEAQSERTKDTALSLACSGGRRDVVEILLKRGANKEHRNVSDYTPLSLAASGGYTDIIQLLLQYGAEINSRTGSKLGISPLMLAAMNGHTQAVKLLLERHADINAQIETNRNTALTLACFQGRHEVVKLLLEHRAAIEHRAKTGLTPLMEAASGGYVEVGKVLLQYEADVNCAPVPASRDTALTIAADKGHTKFVELLLLNGAQVDCKTKKGCTALWLASNSGHLEVCQALVKFGTQVDEPDNRGVTPLMAAFRKGHVKVVKWMVRHVQQFPSDQECTRYLATVNDKETLAKCRQAVDLIMAAKDRQAQEANKAAAVLLQELEQEQQLAETRRQAKKRQKEKKKLKRQAKKAGSGGGKTEVGNKLEDDGEEEEDEKDKRKLIDEDGGGKEQSPIVDEDNTESSRAASGSRSASGSTERFPGTATVVTAMEDIPRLPHVHEQGFKGDTVDEHDTSGGNSQRKHQSQYDNGDHGRRRRRLRRPRIIEASSRKEYEEHGRGIRSYAGRFENNGVGDADGWSQAPCTRDNVHHQQTVRTRNSGISTMGGVGRRGGGGDMASVIPQQTASKHNDASVWRDLTTAKQRQHNKILVSAQAIARVIGRGGQNINAIREASGAHIEVEKQQKGQTDRLITIRGPPESTKQATLMINILIDEPDVPVQEIVNKVKGKEQRMLEAVAPAKITQKDHTMGVAHVGKPNGFPEISVWVPTPAKSQRHAPTQSNAATSSATSVSHAPTYTMASGKAKSKVATSTTTGVPNLVKNAEYSPFGGGTTLNVWQQRAFLLQQKKRADFASVAAAGLGNNSSGVSAAPNSSSQLVSTSDSIAMSKTSTQIDTPAREDLKKAPGYRENTRTAGIVDGGSMVPKITATPQQMDSNALLDETAHAIAAAAALNTSSTPPANSHFYTGTASVDVSSLDDGAVTDLSVYFSSLATPKTSFSSPASCSRAQTQRNSLGFDNMNVTQMAALYEKDNGRRSAGATTAYFSPIALPRPASATATINVNEENGSGTPPPETSATHSLAALLQQLQERQEEEQHQHDFHSESSTGSVQFPRPIGGERGGLGGGSRGPIDFTGPPVNANTFATILDAWGLSARDQGPVPDEIDWATDLNGLSADLARLQVAQQEQSGQQNFALSNELGFADAAGLSNGTSGNYDSDLLQQALLLAANWQQRGTSHPPPLPPMAIHPPPQHMYSIPPPPFPPPVPPPGFTAPPPLVPPLPAASMQSQHINVPPPPLGVFQNCQPVWSTTEREWKFTTPSGNANMTAPPRGYRPTPATAVSTAPSATEAGDGLVYSTYQPQQPQAQMRGWSGGWNSMAMQ